MTCSILHVAIHDLERNDGGFQVRIGNGQLAVTSTTQRVIDDLYNLYKRRSSKTHGKFSTEDSYTHTQNHIREYLNGEITFDDMTAKLMGTLRHEAGSRNAAQGGHVFFAHFDNDNKSYLSVAIINDKLGAALTRTYDVADIMHLDMEGFRFAGRINLSGWQSNEERYIGFLKGKGSVSEYFRAFLGCDDAVQERQDTYDLVKVIKQYADDNYSIPAERDSFLARAKDICDRKARARDEIDFEALANELQPDSPGSLLETLADPEKKLNDRFVPDRRALSSLIKFRARTEHWSIEFERKAISSGTVKFDAEENTLTLTQLPEDLSRQLREEMSSHA